jgi:hypothetical protein
MLRIIFQLTEDSFLEVESGDITLTLSPSFPFRFFIYLLLLQHVKVFQLINGFTVNVPYAKRVDVLNFNCIGYPSLLLAPTSRPMFSIQANSFFQVTPVSRTFQFYLTVLKF